MEESKNYEHIPAYPCLNLEYNEWKVKGEQVLDIYYHVK